MLIILGLAGSWLGLLGRWHWALDQFSHFRWQYLALCIPSVAWTLWRKRRWLLMASLAILILNGWLIGSVSWSEHPVGKMSDATLRVVSLNVLTSNPNKEGVLNYLQRVDADVLFLMEVDDAWVQALEDLKKSHPHHLVQARRDNFGLAIFSRIPLKDAHFIWHRESQVASVEARAVDQGHELVILGTHPLPPIGALGTAMRDAQLKSIAAHVATLDVPVLVIGDLNSAPWSHGMNVLKSGSTLTDRGMDSPAMPTWRVGSIVAIPIDHALCTPPLVITGRKVGRYVGSDHRPLEVAVGWLKPSL